MSCNECEHRVRAWRSRWDRLVAIVSNSSRDSLLVKSYGDDGRSWVLELGGLAAMMGAGGRTTNRGRTQESQLYMSGEERDSTRVAVVFLPRGSHICRLLFSAAARCPFGPLLQPAHCNRIQEPESPDPYGSVQAYRPCVGRANVVCPGCRVDDQSRELVVRSCEQKLTVREQANLEVVQMSHLRSVLEMTTIL